MADSHALYRFYDRAGELLYIGITRDPSARWSRHAADKPWWHQVQRIAIELIAKEWLEQTGHVLGMCVCGLKFCGEYECMFELALMASGALLGVESIHVHTGLPQWKSEVGDGPY